MDYRNLKAKLNQYLFKHVGGDKRPVYFDISAIYPALLAVTKAYPQIKQEFENVYRAQPNMPLYHEIDPGETEISNTTEKGWRVFMLYLLGHKPKENRAQCPETCKVLDTIPGMIQAFFSILEPGKNIPLHKGPYFGYLRYHLGLHVPKDHPPRIVVNSQPYTWREGEAVMFDDSWPHQVDNQSEDFRAVLIVDVLRPMPFLPTLANKFATQLVAKYVYGKRVMERLKGYKPSENVPFMN